MNIQVTYGLTYWQIQGQLCTESAVFSVQKTACAGFLLGIAVTALLFWGCRQWITFMNRKSDRKGKKIHKRKKERLARNEKQYRSILATMPEGLIVIEKRGRVVFANDKAASLLDISYERLLKEELSAFDKEVMLEDGSQARWKDLFPEKLQKSEAVHHLVLGIKKPDGRLVWVSINAEPLHAEEDGKAPPRLLLTLTDVSHFKEREQRLRAANALISGLLENLPTGIVAVDTEYKIIFVNRDFCKLFGLPVAPNAHVGKDVREVVPDYRDLFLHDEDFGKTAPEIVEVREPVLNEEIFLKDGRIFARSKLPIVIDGMYKGNLWKFEEITGRKKMEEKVIAAKENVEKANRTKADFLSMISHELRTPLNGILGFAQLLEGNPYEPLTENQRENVREILAAGRHLLNLLNEILDLAKIETGKLRLSLQPVNVYEMLQESINIIRPLARKNNVRIIDRTAKAKNMHILADPTRFNQVMLNLLSNGVKYNKRGGRLIVSCEAGRKQLTIRVQDTGIGIPRKELQNIFEPFYRLPSAKTKAEGTGIGLTLVQQFVRSMGGWIGVDSVEGKGSCFWIRFPVVKGFLKTRRVEEDGDEDD
ncbi:hypothetical protein BSNK01_05310 [Bacillaceae bacterium]